MASYVNTLGFKNNNYGNIRFYPTIKWHGQIGSNGGFAVFDSPVNGTRALMKQLKTYIGKGKNTIAEIIATYAPSHENDTSKYIANVSAWTGFLSTQKLKADEKTLKALSSAIIRKEIGMPAPESLLSAAYQSLGRASVSDIAKAGGISLGMIAIVAVSFYLIWKSGALVG